MQDRDFINQALAHVVVHPAPNGLNISSDAIEEFLRVVSVVSELLAALDVLTTSCVTIEKNRC